MKGLMFQENALVSHALLWKMSSSVGITPVLVAMGTTLLAMLLLAWLHPGGVAWGLRCLTSIKLHCCHKAIPGPRGLPLVGSLFTFCGAHGRLAHKHLSELAKKYNAYHLMALSLGKTRLVVCSDHDLARVILSSPAFASRPVHQSARHLLFSQSLGFSPFGHRWRHLRHLAATHLFSPARITSHQSLRHFEISAMLDAISNTITTTSTITLRPFLQHAALNNILTTIFGKRYPYPIASKTHDKEAAMVHSMVREGFELLGAFNLVDHIPSTIANLLDDSSIASRCDALVPKVNTYVRNIIHEHKLQQQAQIHTDTKDFVDVLLSLEGEDKLSDDDMVAILWEMIFRGTDTIAIAIEWILAELVLHPNVQEKLQCELDTVMSIDGSIKNAEFLQAVVKEGLRLHLPGPLLSWARLSVHDVEVDGHLVPAGTTTMVNMWAITHDEKVWEEPEKFKPERFMKGGHAEGLDVKGGDLRLAPFGAGARVCPGRVMAMATLQMWIAHIIYHFQLSLDPNCPVDLSELLKLSCEMAHPLSVIITPRVHHSNTF